MIIRVVEFSRGKGRGDTKLGRFLPKNQHTKKKLFNFEYWCSNELSKIEHHCSNKVFHIKQISFLTPGKMTEAIQLLGYYNFYV